MAAVAEHLTADLVDVAAERLRDASLLSGLLVAMASAVGFASAAIPLVRMHSDGGVSVYLLADGCHVTVHTHPARGVLLLDVLVVPPLDPQRAMDVAVRRLGGRESRSDRRSRG